MKKLIGGQYVAVEDSDQAVSVGAAAADPENLVFTGTRDQLMQVLRSYGVRANSRWKDSTLVKHAVDLGYRDVRIEG